MGICAQYYDWTSVVKSLRRATRLPLDCHLMIENPDQYIADFARRKRLDFGASGGVPAFEPDAASDQAA